MYRGGRSASKTLFPNLLKIPLYLHILRFIDFSCMSITVLLQKTRASYVPWFDFGGPFFGQKFYLQIANFEFFPIFVQNTIFYFQNSWLQFLRWRAVHIDSHPLHQRQEPYLEKIMKSSSIGPNSRGDTSAPPWYTTRDAVKKKNVI